MWTTTHEVIVLQVGHRRDLSNLPDPMLTVVGGQPVWDPDQRWPVRE